MRKKWMLTLLCAFALLGLVGCTSTADVLPSPSPMASALPMQSPNMMMPETNTMTPDLTPTGSPDTQTATNLGITTAADSKRVSEAVEDELEKLSEVKDVEALVLGNVALVGLTFDTQYQSGVTTRMKDMVKDRIGTVQQGITTVAITDDPAMVKAIDDLEDALEGSGSLTDVTTKMNTIVQKITNTTTTTMP